MPALPRWFSMTCLVCLTSAVEGCSSASTSRASAEPPITYNSSAAPIEVDSIMRFPTTISFDSTLSSGEIAGAVVSASTDAPAPMVEVWIDYPAHRHTERLVHTGADGNFRIKGLPDEAVMLHAGGLGFRTDSVRIDPEARSFVRFALPVTRIILNY